MAPSPTKPRSTRRTPHMRARTRSDHIGMRSRLIHCTHSYGRTDVRSPEYALIRGDFSRAAGMGPARQMRRARETNGLPLRQLIVAFAETLQAERKPDSFLGRLEDEEGRGLAAAQLAHQLVVHHDLGIAAARQAFDEAGAP